MEKFVNLFKKVQLFDEISQSDLVSLTTCLSAKIERYAKNQIIFAVDDIAKYVGIVLAGNVRIEKDDYYGNKTILSTIHAGETFAESFAFSDISNFPINAISMDDSIIMLIDYRKIITTCAHGCPFHSKLIFNMLKIIAQKNIVLNQKIEFLSKRTTREKLIAYLSHEAKKAQNSYFTISFNRQELADFLCVDRSAMSSELCKMRDDGILEFFKNEFKLYHVNTL